ncbi:MAG: pitrilysin family protein, partial [Bacteroidota bacterium]
MHPLRALIPLVCACTAAAQTLRTDECTLPNGLTVVTVEDHTLPSICFALAFRTGSRNERSGRTGISHLFEHMMFNGSERYAPGTFDRILEAGGGYSNAFTSNDITLYYEEFPPDLLEKVLELEADRLRALRLDEANLEQERGIVMEERRVSTEDDVQSSMTEELYAAAFTAHPYRHPIIGWMSDIGAITLEDARDYFRTYYAPNNAVAFLVGDVDPRTVRTQMERLFAGIPSRPDPPSGPAPDVPRRGERRVKLH